jgi:ferredoxin
MTQSYTIRIRDRQTDTQHTFEVPADRYILHAVENQGGTLPFSCRNGACTTCAVRVLQVKSTSQKLWDLSQSCAIRATLRCA